MLVECHGSGVAYRLISMLLDVKVYLRVGGFGWDELAFAVFVGGAEGVAAVGE